VSPSLCLFLLHTARSISPILVHSYPSRTQRGCGGRCERWYGMRYVVYLGHCQATVAETAPRQRDLCSQTWTTGTTSSE